MTFPLDGTLRISSSSSSRFDRHGQRRMNDQILPLAHCELDPRTTTTHSRSKRETDKNGTKRKRIVLFDAKPPATVPSPSFYALSSSSSRTKGFLLFDLAPLSLFLIQHHHSIRVQVTRKQLSTLTLRQQPFLHSSTLLLTLYRTIPNQSNEADIGKRATKMSTATLDPGLTTGDADTAANALAHLNLDELSGPFVSVVPTVSCRIE